jgi:hypothetical protein
LMALRNTTSSSLSLSLIGITMKLSSGGRAEKQ